MLLWLHIFIWRGRLVTLSSRLICRASWQWYCHRCPSGLTENLSQQELYLVSKTCKPPGNQETIGFQKYCGKCSYCDSNGIGEHVSLDMLQHTRANKFHCEDIGPKLLNWFGTDCKKRPENTSSHPLPWEYSKTIRLWIKHLWQWQ